MDRKWNRFFGFPGKLLLRLLIAILAGALLLSLVYCIPAEAMEENMEESAQVLYNEGLYPWLHGWCTSMVDNYTDTFMLLHAAYRNDRPVIEQAVNVYRPYFGTKDMPYQDLVDHYIEGQTYTGEVAYARYWHGYLVFLKPMLCVMNYATIRKVNAVVQAAALLTVIWLMVRAKMTRYIPVYLVLVGMLMPTTLAMCLQYSSCYYAMTLGCIALLLAKDHLDRWEGEIFLYIGIFVAFFDFLTYPILTLGVPAALYFTMRKSGSLKEDFVKLVKICFCWCVGYGGMWAGKWILGSLVTGSNQLTGAMDKIQERTGDQVYGEMVEDSAWKAWTENRDYFWNTPVSKLVNLLALVMLILIAVAIIKRRISLKDMTAAVPFVIIACMPAVWYVVLTNHSIIHAWFTNKAMAVMPFALLCMLAKLLPEKEKAIRGG